MITQPSQDWTKEERESLMVELINELRLKAEKRNVPPEEILDFTERLGLLLTASTGFLEGNRKMILEGSIPNAPSRFEK